jgi:uncharacterized protein (DUF1697 family)
LLRAINLAGRSTVAMADLREVFTALGFADVRTLLQTGNVVFRGDRAADPALEALLEAETAQRLGLRTDFMVRAADEWAEMIARNPFANAAARDPSHLVVMFLKQAPDAAAVAALQAAVTGPEQVAVHGRHAYVHYAAGIGRSRLTNAVLDTKLGTRGTGRNWNTVLKLAAMLDA